MKILKTADFQKWFAKTSFSVRELVTKRLLRAESGNIGDYKTVGDGVFEIRIPEQGIVFILAKTGSGSSSF